MDGQSKNLTQEYIKQLQAIFPEAVTEVADKDGNNISLKVDMEKLSILLGEASMPEDDTDYKQKYGEKFSFEWAGKRRAIAEAQKRSTGTLRPCPEESEDWENTENLYIEGDNLEVLKLLQDSYLGAIKMIYIDPPYNTGKDFVYKDNYRDNLSNYLEQTNTTNAVNSEASGRYHTNWLNMMYPRLKLARNLLTDDGVIFISIDDNEVSNLKAICDEIFGEDNFVGIFCRKTKSGGGSASDSCAIEHDYVMAFARTSLKAKALIVPFGEEYLKRYKEHDDIGDFFWDTMERSSTKTKPYIIIAPDGSILKGKWFRSEETFKNDLKNGEVRFLKKADGWSVQFKQRLAEGKKLRTILDTEDLTDNKYKSLSEELIRLIGCSMEHPPKPLNLLSTLILSVVKADDYILDFFSGSATTAHAVIQLNAEDGGNRKYIMVQLPEKTPEGSEAKKAGFNTIPELAQKRIRRAGKKILEEQKNKKQGDLFTEPAKKLDIGFKVFKLDRSNVADWDLELNTTNEKDAKETLALEFNKVLNILKEGRTELDLLYEVMLKLGLQLTTKVEEKEINGKNVFVVGHGIMVASFAKELTYSDITKMLEYKPDYVQPGEFKVVLSDESFASNNDKVNVMQLFKQKGITNFEII